MAIPSDSVRFGIDNMIACRGRPSVLDNVFVSVKVAVQQAVIPEAVEAAIYKLSDVTAQIDSFVSDV
eukprot:4484655-Amphidinium_carterae.1